MTTKGNISVSVLAGHIEVDVTSPNERIGQQVIMGDDLYFHITPDVAKQWISVLETITKDSK